MMSFRLHSERSSYNDGARRKRYSHPIRAIHYSAPERKEGRAERGGKSHRKRDEGLRDRQEEDRQAGGKPANQRLIN